MRPDGLAHAAVRPSGRRAHLRIVPAPRVRVADVALFYGERSGGIRTYLDAKVRHAEAAGLDHHLIVPGRHEHHDAGRHELPSLRLAASNGYRLPLGVEALKRTLARIRPDVVLLHDPFWDPLGVTRAAHALGARVVAVHHASAALDAGGLPGPDCAWIPVLRRWFRHAYRRADAVMSVVDPLPDSGRAAALPLRFGLEPAFRPRPEVERGEHVLYVGRLGREKGVVELLEAAARARDPWSLRLIGSGPHEDAIRRRAHRLGLGQRVSFLPYCRDRDDLAHAYAAARCVVMPGPNETFGLVGLEAAASGARVVACTSAPSAWVAGHLAETFPPGDVAALGAAVGRARAAPRDLEAASRLARATTWEAAFVAELADLERLL